MDTGTVVWLSSDILDLITAYVQPSCVTSVRPIVVSSAPTGAECLSFDNLIDNTFSFLINADDCSLCDALHRLHGRCDDIGYTFLFQQATDRQVNRPLHFGRHSLQPLHRSAPSSRSGPNRAESQLEGAPLDEPPLNGATSNSHHP